MSDRREVWFVRTSYTGQAYPVTWQGWLATLGFAAFVVALVILGVIIAATAFVIAVVVAIFLVAFAYLRFVLRHSRRTRGVADYREPT